MTSIYQISNSSLFSEIDRTFNHMYALPCYRLTSTGTKLVLPSLPTLSSTCIRTLKLEPETTSPAPSMPASHISLNPGCNRALLDHDPRILPGTTGFIRLERPGWWWQRLTMRTQQRWREKCWGEMHCVWTWDLWRVSRKTPCFILSFVVIPA